MHESAKRINFGYSSITERVKLFGTNNIITRLKIFKDLKNPLIVKVVIIFLCMCRSEIDIKYFPPSLSSLFFETGSLAETRAHGSTRLPERKGPGSSCSHLLSGVTACTAPPGFYVCAGAQSQVLAHA